MSLFYTHQLKVLEYGISKNHLWELDIKFKDNHSNTSLYLS